MKLRWFFVLILLIFSTPLFAGDSTKIAPQTSASVTPMSKVIMTVMHIQPMMYTWGDGAIYCSQNGRLAGRVSKYSLVNPPPGLPAPAPYVWGGEFVYYCSESVWPTDPFYLLFQSMTWLSDYAGDPSYVASNPYCGPREACSMLNTKPPVIGFNAAMIQPMFVPNAAAGKNFIWPSTAFKTLAFVNRWYSFEKLLWTGYSQIGTSGWTDISAFYYIPSKWPPNQSDYYPPGWHWTTGGKYLSLKMDVEGNTKDQSGNDRTLYCSSQYYLVHYDMLGKTCRPVCNAAATDPGGTAWYNLVGATIICEDQTLGPYMPGQPY